jgi:phage repressor protein C with HTH and peptisase S24 domain
MESKLRIARKGKGITLETLSELTGISVSQLSRIEAGTRNAKLENVLRIAGALGLPPEDIADEPLPAGAQEMAQEFVPAAIQPPLPDQMPKDVPVLGSAAGSVIADAFESIRIAHGEPVDYVRRPPALASVPDAYAIYVTGDSMYAMHGHGDLRFVHPHRPVRPGDSVVVMTRHWDNDPGQGYIKIFRRRSGDKVVLSQLNPEMTIEIPAKYVVSIHKVLDMNDLFGV